MPIPTDYPDIHIANRLLDEAEQLNPGPWAQHSRLVAQAARSITARMSEMDAQKAYILGLLHDVGRRAGVYDLLHTLHGYNYLECLGYPSAARICITHGFRIQNVYTAGYNWDGTPQELAFVGRVLAQYEYVPYDRLIQLCDALATGARFCMIEQRLGQSIYACLPREVSPS